MIIAEISLGTCSAPLVMTSANFPEVCQEMSEARFFEETPDLAEWEDETFFYVWEFLEPRWYSRCDSIFSWSSFFFSIWKSTHSTLNRPTEVPTRAFTENCALKVVLAGKLFEDSFGDF